MAVPPRFELERRFDLDGILVHVHGAGTDLATVVDLLLGPYASAGAAGAPDVRVRIERGGPPPSPPAGEPRFRFPPLAAYADPDQDGGSGWRLVDDVAELRVRPAAGVIEGRLVDGAPMPLCSRFAGLTLWVALMECLRARGRYPLHGAAVVAPDGRVLLFPGTKGAGKSTITLTLLEAGYRVVSDDTLFLARGAGAGHDGGGVELWGYRKRFHVRPDLLERRPDLAPHARLPAPFEPQDKRWLALGERFPGRVVEHAGAPAAIYFPAIADAPVSSVTPLSPRAVLTRLFADSSFVFVSPAEAPAHLAVLRALADGAAGAQLALGRDLLAEPRRLLDLLDRPLTLDRGAEPWPSSASASR